MDAYPELSVILFELCCLLRWLPIHPNNRLVSERSECLPGTCFPSSFVFLRERLCSFVAQSSQKDKGKLVVLVDSREISNSQVTREL